MKFQSCFIVVLLALAPGQPLAAQCSVPAGIELTDADRARIEDLSKSRTSALAAALGEDAKESRELVAGLFRDGLPAPSLADIPGEYECRTIKLGSLAPITAYGWFRCTIAAEENAFSIVKTSGSQQFFGTLHPGEDGLLYRGAQNFSDEKPLSYDRQDQERNQVGCLSGVTERGDRLVLELPFPPAESLHDVIELRRVN